MLFIFYLLFTNEGKVCSKQMIFEAAWSGEYYDSTISDEAIQQAIRRLRKQIELNPGKPTYIIVRRGFGYVFFRNKWVPNWPLTKICCVLSLYCG